MAFHCHIELEAIPNDWVAVKQALALTGIENFAFFADEEKGFEAEFLNSPAYITAFTNQINRGAHEIRAEGRHGCNFLVRDRITIRYRSIDSDKTEADIKTFLTHLVALSPMQFVASYEMYEIQALRDHRRGFVWCWDNPIGVAAA